MVATVVPLVLFYALSATVGTRAGILASLTWAYVMLGRQVIASRRASGLLIVTAFTLTIRCVVWGVHQSTFTYFAVPVVETLCMGALFVVTVALGRPLLVSLARDFVPSLGDHLTRVRYRPLVVRLSCVWGAVYLGSAVTSGALLGIQNLHWFLLLHQVSGWAWTTAGLTISVLYGRRHGRELLAMITGRRGGPVPEDPYADAGAPTFRQQTLELL
jgi:hypothetical protein